MKVWLYSIIWNEARMLPWFLRHYESWVDRFIIYDDRSTDGSRDILKAHPKVELRDWPHRTGLDDEKFREAYNNYYKEAAGEADWVLWPDADELLLHPNPRALLENSKPFDMIGATGYALISERGMPEDDGKSQLYDLVRTGARQDNYDKYIAWRPTATVTHAHGRHTYKKGAAFEWPRCSGALNPEPQFKLLHCHHIAGIGPTIARNQRNYERAHDKRFAWNMSPDKQADVNQGGTVAWLEKLIATKGLVDVIGERPIKLNLGCGSNHLPGWRNHDADMDLRKPLPFKDGSVSHISAEHCLEHITPAEAWRFFEEAKRVLIPGGVLRVAIPDVQRIWLKCTPEYAAAVKKGGHGDGSERDAVKAAICCHGHQAAWTEDLLATVMEAVGFEVRPCEYGQSTDPALVNCEGHHKVVGLEIAKCETSCVEGVK